MATGRVRPVSAIVWMALVVLLPALDGLSWRAAAQPVSTTELVMFVEPGCPWCRRWDQEVGAAYPRSPEGQRAPLRRVHIAEARRAGFSLAGAVTVTPTFVLVDGGNEIGRITGYPGPDFFWSMLVELIGRLPAPAVPSGARDAGLRRGDPLRVAAATSWRAGAGRARVFRAASPRCGLL